MLGIQVSFWKGLFSGVFGVSFREDMYIGIAYSKHGISRHPDGESSVFASSGEKGSSNNNRHVDAARWSTLIK